MENGVIVAHPGTQHSYETALGLQRAGLLKCYVTGFYYKPTSRWSRSLELLPKQLRTGLERELHRRYKPELDPVRVHTLPAVELLHVLANRAAAVSHLDCAYRLAEILRCRRGRRVEACVATMLKGQNPGALRGYDGSALHMFRAARARGIPCVLDQSIAHICVGWQLLSEEAERNPDFADTLSLRQFMELREMGTEEVLLADLVIAGSSFVKHSLEVAGVDPQRICVIPYGVDLQCFRPAPRDQDGIFRVLFVGQLSQRKGIKYLLEAFQTLHLPAAELVLVGQMMGSGLGLGAYSHSFRHLASVPHAQVPSLFQSADIFVYPSLYEGSALVTYEALACGLPVVTSANSGSVVRDGIEGFIVPICDVQDLQQKILLLYENPGLREEMSRRARQRAEEFGWSVYQQRVGQLFGQLLETRG